MPRRPLRPRPPAAQRRARIGDSGQTGAVLPSQARFCPDRGSRLPAGWASIPKAPPAVADPGRAASGGYSGIPRPPARASSGCASPTPGAAPRLRPRAAAADRCVRPRNRIWRVSRRPGRWCLRGRIWWRDWRVRQLPARPLLRVPGCRRGRRVRCRGVRFIPVRCVRASR